MIPEEEQIVELVAKWVDDEVRPVASGLEHSNTYPADLIEQMKQMGVYGLTVPPPFGASAVSARCYARVTEEIARGWMSLAGAFGGHSVVSKLIVRFGTDEQQRRYLPRLATGELRATMALTEPDGGSDLQAMRTVATPVAGGFVINGTKTWITNARTSDLIALLCKTEPFAAPPHRGISILLVEKGPGLSVSRDLPKLGYKGIESCELHFDDCRVPADALLGGVAGKGFPQMMTGLETGRIQVAGRAIGVARAAFDDALRYAQDRHALRRPDLAAPVGRQPARRHGHEHHGRPAAQLPRRRLHRLGPPRRHGGRDGKAVLFGDGGQGDARRDPRPWGSRLLDRARCRAVLPRRSADDRRRGHQ